MKSKIDLIGLCCSVPQMLVYSKIKKMNSGDVLEIVVEKESSQENDIIKVLNHFAQSMRLSIDKTEDKDMSIYTVKK
jgi:tRNA 2-thiouridine synthesizing protein A